MSLTTGPAGFAHVPLYEGFAARIDDEAPEPLWSDAIGWATAVRRTADLVAPDLIALSGYDALITDLQRAVPWTDTEASNLSGLRLNDALGDPTDRFVEAAEIVADVRAEPVVAVLPSPVSVCLECVEMAWLDAVAADEFAALDALHEISQVLTDLLRALGGTVDGVILDWQGVETALGQGLSYDDALLETGAVFNVAGHHDQTLVARFSGPVEEMIVEQSADEFATILVDPLDLDRLGSLVDREFQPGGGFPQSVWALEEPVFRTEIERYLEAAPPSFVLAPELPADVDPERVQLYRELIESA
jgi:hypothetical protein